MGVSRRQFFRLRPGASLRLTLESGEDPPAAAPVHRPPGALPDPAAFLAACTACGLCAEACPHQAISPLGPSAGAAEGTPRILPNETPCHWCADMPCVAACADGALVFPDDPDDEPAPIGRAALDLATCLTTHGTLCEDCAAVCPARVRAVTMRGRRPVLDPERCVGCGLCVHHCDARPVAIQVGAPDRSCLP